MRKKARKSAAWEWTKSLIIAGAIVLFVRHFLFQNFKVPTGSMEDTILVGDFLFANKMLYGPTIPFTYHRIFQIRDPHRNDVFVFRYPLRPRVAYIKRCVAVAGDTVEIRNKVLYINGVAQEEPWARHTDWRVYEGVTRESIPQYQQLWESGQFIRAGTQIRDNFGPVVVPEGTVFAMGDNRDNSHDSRYWGPLDDRLVLGKALFLYWSWKKDVPFYRLWEKIRWNRLGRLIK